MSIKLHLTAGALAAGFAAAVLAAPIASAADDPHMVCTAISDGNTQCETPGNAQLSATPPDVPYPTLYPFLYGNAIIIHNGPGHGMR